MKTQALTIPNRFIQANYEKDVPDFVKEFVKKFKETRKGLYIFGNPGTGKTHMSYAICKKVEEEGTRVLAFSSVEILQMIKDDMRLKEDNYHSPNGDKYFGDGYFFLEGLNKFKGLLFIDDIGLEKSTEWANEMLTRIIDKKYEDVIPMIITSNCDLSELGRKMGDRVSSRIYQMCDVINMNGSDKRLEI